jgi:hypothetical protein
VGYDFCYMRLSHPPPAFPAQMPDGFGHDSLLTLGDRDRVLEQLLSRTGSRPNGPQECWWDTPGGGSICFALWFPGEFINVDTHTHWRYVLEAYLFLLGTFPDLVIIDPQTATMHDAQSFAAFIEESYARQS